MTNKPQTCCRATGLNEDIHELITRLGIGNKGILSKNDTLTILTRLCHLLKEIDCVEKAFETLPETGHLLACLFATDFMRGDPEMYHKVMECMLCLYREYPKSALERKANNWTLAQVKSSLSSEQLSSYSVCGTSTNVTTVTLEHVHWMVDCIVPEMKKFYKSNSQHCQGDDLDAVIVPLTSLLFSVSDGNIFNSLWEVVLDILKCFSSNNEVVNGIYRQLTEHLKKTSHDDKDKYGILCRICQLYRPALEQQVLHLVDTCKGFILPSSFKQVMLTHPLPVLCTESDQIMLMTFQMLHVILRETNGSHNVACLIHSLYQSSQGLRRKSHNTEVMGSCVMYPPSLLSLVSCMEVFPSDLNIQQSAHHIEKICRHINILKSENSISNTDMPSEHLCLLHHMAWYDRAMQIFLMCKKEYVEVCLDLVIYYHYLHDLDSSTHIKRILLIIVTCLRSLLVKRTLGASDLLCTVSTGSEVKYTAKDTIISQMLLAFLFLSTGGLTMISHILEMATKSKDKYIHLAVLMESHEHLNVDFCKWAESSLKEYRLYVESLIQYTATRSNCDKLHVLSSAKQFVNDTCVNKK